MDFDWDKENLFTDSNDAIRQSETHVVKEAAPGSPGLFPEPQPEMKESNAAPLPSAADCRKRRRDELLARVASRRTCITTAATTRYDIDKVHAILTGPKLSWDWTNGSQTASRGGDDSNEAGSCEDSLVVDFSGVDSRSALRTHIRSAMSQASARDIGPAARNIPSDVQTLIQAKRMRTMGALNSQKNASQATQQPSQLRQYQESQAIPLAQPSQPTQSSPIPTPVLLSQTQAAPPPPIAPPLPSVFRRPAPIPSAVFEFLGDTQAPTQQLFRPAEEDEEEVEMETTQVVAREAPAEPTQVVERQDPLDEATQVLVRPSLVEATQVIERQHVVEATQVLTRQPAAVESFVRPKPEPTLLKVLPDEALPADFKESESEAASDASSSSSGSSSAASEVPASQRKKSRKPRAGSGSEDETPAAAVEVEAKDFEKWLARRRALKERKRRAKAFIEGEAEESEDEDLRGITRKRGGLGEEDEEDSSSDEDEADLADLVASATEAARADRRAGKDKLAKLHQKWMDERDAKLQEAIQDRRFRQRKTGRGLLGGLQEGEAAGLSRLQKKLQARHAAHAQQYDADGNPLAPELDDDEDDEDGYDSMELGSDLVTEDEEEGEPGEEGATAEESEMRRVRRERERARRVKMKEYQSEMLRRRADLKVRLKTEKLEREKDTRELFAGVSIMDEEDQRNFKVLVNRTDTVGFSRGTPARPPKGEEEKDDGEASPKVFSFLMRKAESVRAVASSPFTAAPSPAPPPPARVSVSSLRASLGSTRLSTSAAFSLEMD